MSRAVTTMVHVTRAETAARILVEGLRPDMGNGLTSDCAWVAPWYGDEPVIPVFVGRADSRFVVATLEDDPDLEVFEVDVSGLPLVADLASLVDLGAHVENGVLWWREGREPPALLPWLVEGEVAIPDLLDPGGAINLAAIESTGTAAHVGPIAADRIAPVPRGPTP